MTGQTDWHRWAHDRRIMRNVGTYVIMGLLIGFAIVAALGYGTYDYNIGRCFDHGGNIVRDTHAHKGWRCQTGNPASHPGGNE